MLTAALLMASISVVDAATQVALWVFIASAALALGSLLSRPGSRQFGDKSYGEIVKFNPPAAFYAAFGRLLPLFLRVLLVSSALLATFLVIRALV